MTEKRKSFDWILAFLPRIGLRGKLRQETGGKMPDPASRAE